MSITITAPDLEAMLHEGARSFHISVEEYTISVLRAALDALASDSEMIPSARNVHPIVAAPSPAFDPLMALDEDELEDRRQSAEYLRRALDEARLSKHILVSDEQTPHP